MTSPDLNYVSSVVVLQLPERSDERLLRLSALHCIEWYCGSFESENERSEFLVKAINNRSGSGGNSIQRTCCMGSVFPK